MTRKSKAKQERYYVEFTDITDGAKWLRQYGNLEQAQYAVSTFKVLKPAIFKLVRVRSKPKSGGGGRK